MPREFTTVLLMLMGSFSVVCAQQPDRPSDRADIQAIIAQLNTARKSSNANAFVELFTSDGELRIENEATGVSQEAIAALIGRRAIWSETTAPRIEGVTIRFITPDVALCDGSQVQYGSLALGQTAPVMLLLRRETGGWKVASLRIYAALRPGRPATKPAP